MVIGVGFDLASIDHWRRVSADAASDAVGGTFTPAEVERARGHAGDPAERLASRHAAKEAFIKALSSCNLHLDPVVGRIDLRQIEVDNDQHGRPFLRLHGEAGAAARSLGVVRSWLSLSHENDLAAAVVVLEG